jgi:nucleoside phosphorylase
MSEHKHENQQVKLKENQFIELKLPDSDSKLVVEYKKDCKQTPKQNQNPKLNEHTSKRPTPLVSETLVDNTKVDFLIITALQKEFYAVKQKLGDVQSVDDIAYFTTVNCPNGKYLLILACQLYSGQQEATALTATLCERYKPRYVLLVGIAGGNKDEKVKLGDIIIAKRIEDCTKGKIADSGVWQPEWTPFSIDAELIRKVRDWPNSDWRESIKEKRPDKKKQAPEIKEGVIISGGNVIKEEVGGKWLETIKARETRWLGVEMEGGGVATAIAHYMKEPRPKFLMIRCVTDFADDDKNDHWHLYACDVAAAYTYAFLKSGPITALNKT